MIVSDRQQMFGRLCPKCEGGYFRMLRPGDWHWCPYCRWKGPNAAFLTQSQRALIDRVRSAFTEIAEGTNRVEIDLDAINSGSSETRPTWAYKEETQQFRVGCSKCDEVCDVLGEYVYCAGCGNPTWESVFGRKVDLIQKQFDLADSSLQDRPHREAEWGQLIVRCISAFEGLARKIQAELLQMPMHPTRRRDLRSVSFQGIPPAAAALKELLGFDFLERWTKEDVEFLSRQSLRRHLYTHAEGIVDAEYLERTGDSSVRLNQKLRPRSNEVGRLIELIRRAGISLIKGSLAIGPP